MHFFLKEPKINRCTKCCDVVGNAVVWKSTVKVNRTVLLLEEQLYDETTCQSTCYTSLADVILHCGLTPQHHVQDAFHVNGKHRRKVMVEDNARHDKNK